MAFFGCHRRNFLEAPNLLVHFLNGILGKEDFASHDIDLHFEFVVLSNGIVKLFFFVLQLVVKG
jgi:hypothetical protein